MPDDDSPTGVAPTELGAAIDETEAVTAWSLDDGEEWEPPRRLTPARITALALAASLTLLAGAGGLAHWHLSQPVLGDVAMIGSSGISGTAPKKFDAETGFPDPPPPPPPPAPPAPATVIVERPAPPAGSVYSQITPEALAAMDRQFLANIQAEGWAVWDPTLMTQRAHQVCAQLSQGSSPSYVAQRIAADSGLEPGMAMSMAQNFVSTTMATYAACP